MKKSELCYTIKLMVLTKQILQLRQNESLGSFQLAELQKKLTQPMPSTLLTTLSSYL